MYWNAGTGAHVTVTGPRNRSSGELMAVRRSRDSPRLFRRPVNVCNNAGQAQPSFVFEFYDKKFTFNKYLSLSLLKNNAIQNKYEFADKFYEFKFRFQTLESEVRNPNCQNEANFY